MSIIGNIGDKYIIYVDIIIYQLKKWQYPLNWKYS